MIVFLEQGSPLGLSKYGPVCSALASGSLFYSILSFGLMERVLEHTFEYHTIMKHQEA